MKNEKKVITFIMIFIITFLFISCRATTLTVTAPEKSELTKTVNIQTITTTSTTAPEPSGCATSEYLSSRKEITAEPQKSSTTTEYESTSTTTKPTERKTTASEYESDIQSAAFYYDDKEPVYITAEEYYTICGIVMNEAGAYYGSYEGRIAVAQSIRNQIIREKKLGHKYDIESVRSTYGLHYTKKPSDEVRRAVTDVFHNHIVVTSEPIIAWCASGKPSDWHKEQILVCSIGGNDFYKLKVKDW